MPEQTQRHIDPIEKNFVVDTLADRILQRILHNDIEPGALLRQGALASAYGVSRMPVREALRQLEAEPTGVASKAEVLEKRVG